MEQSDAIKKLSKYLWVYRVKLIFIGISICIYTVSKVLGPFLMGKAIDDYISKGNQQGLATLLIVLAAVYFSTSFFGWIQNFVMIGVAGDALQKLRIDLFAKLQTLSLRYFDSTPHGEIMSRFSNDIDNINVTLSQSLVEMISNILTLIGVIIFMLFLSWKLALITIVFTPIILLITNKIAKKTRSNFALQQEKLGNVNAFVEENISGFKSIKAYDMGDEISDRFKVINEELSNASVDAQIYSGVVIPIINVFNNVNLAIIVWIGAIFTLKGAASIGMIVSFINFARQFFQPLNQIANLYNQIQLAITGSNRVFEVMAEKPDISDKENAKEVETLGGDIDLNHVNFGYKEGTLVLKDINIHADKGKMIALIGPTGSGKSTIINLLTRFYEINSGEILFDGNEIKDLKVKDLRKRIGIVLQDSVIFSGTIKDNIRYGKLDASDEEIMYAAKLAEIDSFIEDLPDKYDTELDENGGVLSVGQKQLITIARTILSDPDILILDEATSNIDTITEFKIQTAMNKIMKGRTSFVIAHRLKTILNADEIIVLKDGNIIEQGNHETLLKKNGFYAELYKNQFSIKSSMVY